MEKLLKWSGTTFGTCNGDIKTLKVDILTIVYTYLIITYECSLSGQHCYITQLTNMNGQQVHVIMNH